MSDKNIYREDNDVFSDLIKQKLENHQMPVDESLWADIEQQLAAVPTKQKRRIAYWQWIASGVAAVIALALLTYKPQENLLQTPELSQKQEQSAETGSEPVISDKEPASYLSGIENAKNPQSAPVASSKTAGLFSKKTKKSTLDNKSNTTLAQTSKQEETSKVESTLQKEESETVGQKQETYANNNEVEKATKPSNKIDNLPDLNDYPEITEYTKRPKKKQRVLLAATVGGGNTLSNSSGENKQVLQRLPKRQLVNSKEITEKYASINEAQDFSNAQHYAPLSFGVRVEKPLTDWLSLESGLTYTYLKSIFKGTGEEDSDGKLESHYVGIPLNIRAKIINGSKWDLYGSVGGMAEKGVHSVYEQLVGVKSKITNTRVEYTIDGLQWSFNGAVGVEYKISKDLRLFVEPQITYYIENNQPMSARTEQPLNLGLNGGLRIEL